MSVSFGVLPSHSLPVSDVGTLGSAEDLLALLASGYRSPADERRGGERVDQLVHALQCAYQTYLARPHDDELQVAALVHDIGHLLVPDDEPGHGRHGAAAVRGLLGERVATLVELHVPAKRYLVTTDASYQGLLSSASVHTLLGQGGSMTGTEIRDFERTRWSLDAVVLRKADDAAKVPGVAVPPLLSWRPVIESVIAAQR